MRPRRLYIETDTKKPYYIINKKKVYVKVPKGTTLKQLQKVNIKNIIQLPQRKRVKRRTKKVQPILDKKIAPSMSKAEIPTGGLPLYLFQEKKEIPELATAGREKKNEKPKAIMDMPSVLIPTATKLPMAKLIEAPEEQKKIKDKPPVPKRKKRTYDKKEAEIIAYEFFNSDLGVDATQNDYDDFVKWWNLPSTKDIQIGEYKIKDLVIPNRSLYESLFQGMLEDMFLKEAMKEVKKEEKKQEKKERRKMRKEDIDINTPPKKSFQELFSESILGKGDKDGLLNDEIEMITRKRLKRFVPVIPADKTDDLLKYVKKGDKEFAFVINTNPSQSDGSGTDGYRPGHWTCVYIDNRDDYPSAEFFDPLVEGKIPNYIVDIIRQICSKMNPEVMFKYKQNLIRRQDTKTATCGYHCIKFIEDRMNGVCFAEASGYDDFIENYKGVLDGSKQGEKELMKVLPKYNSYI